MSIRGLLTTSLAVVPGLLLAQADLTHKVSARLWDLVGVPGSTGSQSLSAVPGTAEGIHCRLLALVPTEGGSVVISAIADTNANALAAQLQALGLTHGGAAGRVVSGWLPV